MKRIPPQIVIVASEIFSATNRPQTIEIIIASIWPTIPPTITKRTGYVVARAIAVIYDRSPISLIVTKQKILTKGIIKNHPKFLIKQF
jgi:hypothetical protein